MIKRIYAAMVSLLILASLPFHALAEEEAVGQINYWTTIAMAIRDFIFIVMFIAGIVIFFIAVIVLVKDYVMADAQRGEKKFSIGELGLGIVLAGALVSPFGLLQVGSDAAGGSLTGDEINATVFTEAGESQSGSGGADPE